ncbi:hypothetical protein [Acetobacter vaccinii]|uniref:Uncharacterized protein n=1 Tax=Acetobacter vaccinii TaxID=2592655 RepID=A0A5C1YNM4_9PROT|nr:hypothetical protein [Acetobacter vaccinii]QEO17108.1 hypothetical protein FLP30_04605 [Acetobacter vaccinii]
MIMSYPASSPVVGRWQVCATAFVAGKKNWFKNTYLVKIFSKNTFDAAFSTSTCPDIPPPIPCCRQFLTVQPPSHKILGGRRCCGYKPPDSFKAGYPVIAKAEKRHDYFTA